MARRNLILKLRRRDQTDDATSSEMQQASTYSQIVEAGPAKTFTRKPFDDSTNSISRTKSNDIYFATFDGPAAGSSISVAVKLGNNVDCSRTSIAKLR